MPTWISTITQPTHWRSFQLVNVERAAVANTDDSWPAAAVVAPVKTHFDAANLTSGRVRALKPSWCMRSTAIRWYTSCGHLVSWCSLESIPLSLESIITSNRWSAVSLCSRGIIKDCITSASAFCNWKWKRAVNRHVVFGHFTSIGSYKHERPVLFEVLPKEWRFYEN